MPRRLVKLLVLLAMTLPALAAPKLQPANLSVTVYQRVFPPQRPASTSLELFNLRKAEVRIYPVALESLIPNAAVLDASDDRRNPNSVAGRLAKMTLSRPVKTMTVSPKSFYPNQWVYQELKLPPLPSGVYALEVAGGGVARRTWFAVSAHALVVKRSQDVVTAWLVHASTGKPVAGVPVVLYTANGRATAVTTGADGMARFETPTAFGPLWLAARGKEPAFARASAPEEEKPYVVFLHTDRPIYRPGQPVRFRGTVRAVQRGAYALPAATTVRVQIKTRGDTVVYDEALPLNAMGTFAGDFQLAPEPPLGTYSLEVAIGEYREYAGFEVQAYRKPEFDTTVTMPAAHRLGGEPVSVTIAANYFFGSPVNGGKVKYFVRFRHAGGETPPEVMTAPGLGSAAVTRIEDSLSGEGQLDRDGKLVLTIPTRRAPFNRTLAVEVEVTDLSLRSRSAQAQMLLTGADFRLSLSPDRGQYQPGQTAKVTVSARDYDGKPVTTTVGVTLIEQLIDREKRPYEQRTQRTVQTDREGNGAVSFTLERPGSYRVEARARDARDNPVFARTHLYVEKQQPQPEWPTLEMTPDRGEYAPGDTARLRVRTSKLGASALLTVEGDRLYRAQVISLANKETFVSLPILREFQPGVSLQLMAIAEGQPYTAYATLNVPAAAQKLTVTVTPSKADYRAGETATLEVVTRDHRGQGVPAEVGLGVVDTALYAIRADTVPNPYDVFWHQQYRRVEMDFSLAGTYPGGAFQHIPQPAPPPPPSPQASGDNIRVRKQFEDTAFWSASVRTDDNGKGSVTFTVPDNLTTWRATARALTRTTAAGMVREQFTVTMPLMARLVLPRFYIKDDQATAAALVHNYTGTECLVRVTLSADGARVLDEPSREVRIPAGGIQRLTWTVAVAGRTGSADGDSARFRVSADGGAGAADASESTVPVYPNGVRRVDARAGMILNRIAHFTLETPGSPPIPGGSERITLHVPANALPGSTQAVVTVSPSLAGPVFEALDYLVGYPYGNAEQTMERFLPDIIVTRTLKELNVARPEPPMLRRYVQFGLQKLLRYQHGDGGWNWWEFDQSDPYMTAYIVYGLAMARDAGYPLAAGPLPRGVDYLHRTLGRDDPNHVLDSASATYILLALAHADTWDTKTRPWGYALAQKLTAKRDKLDAFSQASLALALDRLSRETGAPTEFARVAGELAAALEKDAVTVGATAHWTANAGGYGSWLDSDVEVTAQVLQALLALRPRSPRVVPAVRWLMMARQGTSWNSTKDTASAVLALAAYLKQAKELAPDATVILRIGERELTRLTFTPAQAFDDPVRIPIPAEMLMPGGNVLQITVGGIGNLYWRAQTSYAVPVEQAVPLAQGITLQRRFRVEAEDPITAGQQAPGSVVQVAVTLTSDRNYRYVMFEEPIPAGCEVIASGEHPHEWNCDWREVWDNRILYAFDYLPKGETTVTYWLRAESPGFFNILPGVAALQYLPEVRGEGRAAHLKVVEP